MTQPVRERSGLPGPRRARLATRPPGSGPQTTGYGARLQTACAASRVPPAGPASNAEAVGVAQARRWLRARSRHRQPGAPAGMLSHHGSEEVTVEIGPSSARRLLGVFAHPDDEVFCAGGTMAWAAEAGAEVMIVSASRGEQGQIRDPTAATRRTLGAVREGELSAAAAELGVQRVQVLAYPDGGLLHHRSSLGPAIAEIMRQFDPDTVITFGADGGYGHPDHVAISELTSEAFRALARDHNRAQRLYHAVFPPRRTSMAEELAHWIAGSGQRATDRAALQAIALFAGEAATMRLARDDVRVAWFAPGMCVIEQGEPAEALYLILNGTADALLEHPGGQVIHARRMQAGDFSASLAWWQARARRT